MRKALFIGLNDYVQNPLKACINDAKCMERVLKKNGDGSPNFEVKLKDNIKSSAELLSLISGFFSGKCDTALLYFAGHGYFTNIGGYILPTDCIMGVSMNDILTLANQSEITNKIIILDCCDSGSIGVPIIGGSNIPLGDGISILTACRKNEEAEEINGHGVFTNLLLEALKGGAADIGGNITPGSIYAYIDQALGAHDQRPVFKTNITSFTPLRTVKPQVDPDVLREIIKYFPIPTDEYKLDPSYEDTNSITVEHEVIEPYANTLNVQIFKNLQKLQSVGLIVPVSEDYMYFAAMKSKSCKLTALGHHYWRLVNNNRF
jgi:hypothetical protein